MRQSDLSSKRGAAVLEAPERTYAPGRSTPLRGSTTPNRKLRRDFSDDFAGDFDDVDDLPSGRLRSGSVGGLRLRLSGLPTTTKGRVAAGIFLLLCLGLMVSVFLMARTAILHDDRLVIQSSSSVEFVGNAHVTRAQLLSVFGEDVERNIFSVSLSQRRAELEALPWVAHATVMRLLPNRMRVSLVERTPVAFVRLGSHIGLVDAAGVLLDMPADAKDDGSYSFPVVSGISADDPLSTRAARMKIYNRFTSDLDSSGEKISQQLSEVDLSNPEDVKTLIPDHSMDILVHFGDTDFLDRYRKFQQHLPEWRTVYPKLSSVDMRYERQVVLEMQPGTLVPAGDASDGAAGTAGQVEKPKSDPSVITASTASKASKLTGKPVIKAPAAVKHSPVVANKTALAHITAHNDVAFPVKVRAGVKPQTKQSEAKRRKDTAKHPPVVVRHTISAPQYHPPQVIHP